MPTLAQINAEIARAHDHRWEACLNRGERMVGSVRAVVLSHWDQLGAMIREATAGPWTYRRTLAQGNVVLSGLIPNLLDLFESRFTEQAFWAHRSAIDALFGPMPDSTLDQFVRETLEESTKRVGLQGVRRILPPPDEKRVRQILMARVNGLNWRERLAVISSQITNKSGVVDRIAKGVAAGKTAAQIRADILPLVNGIQNSATRIVRMEMRRISNAISEDLWRQSERVLVAFRRRSQRDGRVRPEHVAKDGLRYLVGQPKPSLPDDYGCRCFYVPEFGGLKPKPKPKPKPVKPVVKKVEPKPATKPPSKQSFDMPKLSDPPKYEPKPVFHDFEAERNRLMAYKYEARMREFKTGDRAVEEIRKLPKDPEVPKLVGKIEELRREGEQLLLRSFGNRESEEYRAFQEKREQRRKLQSILEERKRLQREAAWKVIEPPEGKGTSFAFKFQDDALLQFEDDPGAKARIEEAAAWVGRMRRGARKHTEAHKKHPRESGSTIAVTVDYLAPRASMHPSSATLNMGKNSPVETFVHEYGHTLEIEGNITQMTQAFLAKRFGKDAKPLNEWRNTTAYDSDEKSLGDGQLGELFQSIKGDAGSAFYAGKVYEGQSYTEVLSLGVELLYLDPVTFADKDPEYFKLVVGALQGAMD